jgi:hypothetical protein
MRPFEGCGYILRSTSSHGPELCNVFCSVSDDVIIALVESPHRPCIGRLDR